jgi:hypothetical protein
MSPGSNHSRCKDNEGVAPILVNFDSHYQVAIAIERNLGKSLPGRLGSGL